MDGSRFDALSRSLVAGHSRRGLTRLLGGVAFGGPLALMGLAESAAKKKKPCPPCKKRKKDKCKGTLPEGTPCPGGACHGGSCIAAVPPAPLCAQPAAPHFCASATTCVPVCPTGKVFDPASCLCHCAVESTCCDCDAGANSFCQVNGLRSEACLDACTGAGSSGRYLGISGSTAICTVGQSCVYTCLNDGCGTIDGCQAESQCGIGLRGKCFQPLGGGPTRCGESAGLCGCDRHQFCADRFGAGAFCVQVTGSACTGCEATGTFCAVPR